MKNIDKIQRMDTDEFAEWLTKQIWPEYSEIDKKKISEYMLRFHMVRNFLLDEYASDDEEPRTEMPTHVVDLGGGFSICCN